MNEFIIIVMETFLINQMSRNMGGYQYQIFQNNIDNSKTFQKNETKLLTNQHE